MPFLACFKPSRASPPEATAKNGEKVGHHVNALTDLAESCPSTPATMSSTNTDVSSIPRCSQCRVKLSPRSCNDQMVERCAVCSITTRACTQPLTQRPPAALGVIRLDYDYPPAPGDIDHPASFGYPVFYRAVPGLTFEMCQSGEMTGRVRQEFIEAIEWLDVQQGVHAITGDCGFMMWFQELARSHTDKPIFMSSLTALPSMTCALGSHRKVAIFTANGESLEPMHDLIKEECGVETHESRYVIVGCEDVPGFEAVELGEKVDVERVAPGIVAKAKEVIAEHAISAFLFECTELPPYSDAVRYATGLPVIDAITAADFVVQTFKDHPRFGLQGWEAEWDGTQQPYSIAEDLCR